MQVRRLREDELYHHGIKGQRWGIRRYQNPDGTLTEAGKRHYGRQISKKAYNIAKGSKSASDAAVKLTDYLNNDDTAQKLYKDKIKAFNEAWNKYAEASKSYEDYYDSDQYYKDLKKVSKDIDKQVRKDLDSMGLPATYKGDYSKHYDKLFDSYKDDMLEPYEKNYNKAYKKEKAKSDKAWAEYSAAKKDMADSIAGNYKNATFRHITANANLSDLIGFSDVKVKDMDERPKK